ncbi:FtsQ-type POTRA domain-containing protein [Desulfovibrio sp. OttesenSCG-928-C14]|nr:FtsQ-type POTRA domain-containing protein [Desulfovibrio sp. OttesenSCG-928-C14]
MRGYYFFTTSQYFALKTIEIEGINRLESREVLDIVGINYGMNTLSISMESMEKALSRAPWVESLSIKRVLPDRFNIVIKEREPVYWRNLNGVLHYADRWGQPIAPVTPGSFSSLPALDIEPGAEDLAGRLPYLVNSLTRADLPLDTAALAWLRLSSAGAMELKPSDKLSIVIGIEDWQSNLERLNAVLYDLSRRGELRDTAEIKAHGNHVWVSKRMHT